MEIAADQFETYVDGLDHPEDLAFDSEGILWAGNCAIKPPSIGSATPDT